MIDTERAIIHQIQGSTSVHLYTEDFEHPERFTLYEQDGQFWIQPLFCAPKKIRSPVATELIEKFTDEQQFNTDPEVIRFRGTYGEFWDRFYGDGLEKPAILKTGYCVLSSLGRGQGLLNAGFDMTTDPDAADASFNDAVTRNPEGHHRLIYTANGDSSVIREHTRKE